MPGFDRFVAVDWSARSKPAPDKPTRDAIWMAWDEEVLYCRTRCEAEGALAAVLTGKKRILAGFDFALAFPEWAMERLNGWRPAWALIEKMEKQGLSRFEIGRQLNKRLGIPAFWGGELSAVKPAAAVCEAEKRTCELREPGTQSAFKLWGAGSVGGQTLTGIPVLERLRLRFGAKVWPFEDVSEARVVFAEVWPPLAEEGRGEFLDERQVRGLVGKMPEWSLDVPWVWQSVAREEGWILGVPFDHEPPEVPEHRRGSAAARQPKRKRA